MIIVAELQMQGGKHAQVNSGLLQVVTLAFNSPQIRVFCDKKHQQEIARYVNPAFYTFSGFNYIAIKEISKISTVYKTLRETALALKIFTIAKSRKSELIVFASAFPFTALILNFFARIFNQKIIICLHADLGVLSPHHDKIATKFFRRAISTFFKTRCRTTIVLFYGESIKNRLFELFPFFNDKNNIAIDHPYNYSNHELADNPCGRITIMNIGTGILTKNSHYLYQLAELQKLNVLKKEIRFVQIGKVATDVNKYANSYVEIINHSEFVPSSIFEETLKHADYFIYFFSEQSVYDLSPSGSFFDAIKYKKPIISLRNPFFEYYFDKLGDIGYLCSSIAEMNELIDKILTEKNEKEYQSKVTALTKAADLLSIQNISYSFLKQYKALDNFIVTYDVKSGTAWNNKFCQ